MARTGNPVLRRRAPPLDADEIVAPAIQRLIDVVFKTMSEYAWASVSPRDLDGGLPPIVTINPEVEPIGTTVEENWEGHARARSTRAAAADDRERLPGRRVRRESSHVRRAPGRFSTGRGRSRGLTRRPAASARRCNAFAELRVGLVARVARHERRASLSDRQIPHLVGRALEAVSRNGASGPA